MHLDPRRTPRAQPNKDNSEWEKTNVHTAMATYTSPSATLVHNDDLRHIAIQLYIGVRAIRHAPPPPTPALTHNDGLTHHVQRDAGRQAMAHVDLHRAHTESQ